MGSIRFGGGQGVSVGPGFETEIGEIESPDTTVGRMGRQLVEFLSVALPATKGALALTAPKAAATRLGVTEAAAVGSGQLVFDPQDPRLSNLIEEAGLTNPVTRYLQADPNDSEAEARLKMALEDAGIGLAIGSAMEGFRAYRAARTGARRPGIDAPKSPDVSPEVAKAQEGLIDLSTNIEQAKRMREVPSPLPKDEVLPPNLNTNRLGTTDDVKDMLMDVAEKHDNFTPQRRGVVSHEETRHLADTMGLTESQLLSVRKGTALNAHQALSARQALVQSGETLVDLAKKAQGGDDEALFAFQREMAKHASIQETVAGITAEAGRALNSFKIIAQSAGARRAQLIKEMIEKGGGRENVEDMVSAMAQMDTPEGVARMAREAFTPTLKDKFTEIWINGLLSGPQTHAVNMLSNAVTALWTVPEHLIASGLGKLRRSGTDKVYVRDAMARLYGFMEGAKDGAKLASKAFITGEPSDILTKIEVPRQASVGGVTGSLIRTPTRLLQAEDEFFKTIGYRMELNSRAMRDGLEKGLKGRELAEHVQKLKASTPEDLELAAIDTARYQTFTSPVGPIASTLQKAAQDHLWIKLIAPFIRTPTNILKFAAERSPLGFATKRYKDAIKQGGSAADLARSRIAFSTGLGAWMLQQAMAGNVTGGGPSDSNLKGVWREEHQPYSIKMPDGRWVSYSRTEPFAITMGIAADLADVVREVGSDDPEATKVFAMLVASVSNNLLSKTWLTGLSETLRVFDEPHRYGSNYATRFAGSFVPAGIAQAERIQDPILREARSILTGMQQRIPGLSESLPARRNLFGEPIILEGSLGPDAISPLWTKTPANNPVAQEMSRMELKISMPQRKIGSVELTPAQYQEYVGLAGKPAASALSNLIRDPMTGQQRDTWSGLPDIVKEKIIRDHFKTHRSIARAIMIAKHGLMAQEAANIAEEMSK